MSFGIFKDKYGDWMGVAFLELGQGSLLQEFDRWCDDHAIAIVGADDIDRMGWDRYVYLISDERAVLYRLRWDAQVMPDSVHDIFQGFLDQYDIENR